MSQDLGQQIAMLKATTERMGVLHEAQLLQLRNYPIMFDGITSAKTSVDQGNKTVIYECKGADPFRKTAMRKRMFYKLVWMIQQVVWTDTIVEFNVNGKPIYDSRIDREDSGPKSAGSKPG